MLRKVAPSEDFHAYSDIVSISERVNHLQLKDFVKLFFQECRQLAQGPCLLPGVPRPRCKVLALASYDVSYVQYFTMHEDPKEPKWATLQEIAKEGEDIEFLRPPNSMRGRANMPGPVQLSLDVPCYGALLSPSSTKTQPSPTSAVPPSPSIAGDYASHFSYRGD